MTHLTQEIKALFDRIAPSDKEHDLLVARRAYANWFKDYREGKGNLKRHLFGMTQYGLSEEEAVLILSYTARTSSWTNGHCRNSLSLDKDYDRVSHNELLNKVLSTLPAYNSRTVFRMDINALVSQTDCFKWLEKKIGQTMHIPYFWSTSKERWDEKCLVWQIRTSEKSKARDISNLTQSPLEQEVLFMQNSRFAIESVNRSTNTVLVRETDAEIHFPLIGLYHKNY